MFLKLKTLNVKMHRDGSFCTNGLCVLFYSSNKESVIYWATKPTQMPIIIKEEFCTQLNLHSYGINSFIIHKKYIELYSKMDFINIGTFQSEAVIFMRDTAHGTQQFTVGAKYCQLESSNEMYWVMTHCQKFATLTGPDGAKYSCISLISSLSCHCVKY